MTPAPRFPEDRLSVFFPMYQEEANVEGSVQKALEVLPGLVGEYEILVVDDGSTDRTREIAERLAEEHPPVRVARHEVNRGYGAAVRTGLESASMELVFFTDGDLQFDLGELGLLLERIEGADVVCGYRLRRRDPAHRLLNAFLWNRLVRLLLGLRIRDVNCAFKLFRREALQRIEPLETDGAMLSTELMIKLQRSGATIREVGVHHYPRSAGEQTGAKPGVVLKAFRELFAMSRRLKGEGASGGERSAGRARGG